MAFFRFKGINEKGRNIRGQVEADSVSAARGQIKKRGIYVISIENKSQAKLNLSFQSKKVDIKTLAMTTQNLAVLLKSGIPLVDALETVSKQTDHIVMSEVLDFTKNAVNEGQSFYKSLEAFPHIFDKTYISMCEAGELSGTLDIVLFRLAEFKKSQFNLQNKVRSALIYPTIMLIFSVFMIVFLLAYVVPKVRVLFEDNASATIPWYSMMLLNASDFLKQYWMGALVLLITLFITLWMWKKSDQGRKTWDRLSLKFPVFGKLIRSVAISRLSRTLSTLLKGGVPVVEALDVVKNVSNNQVIYNIISQARISIEKGESLSAPLIRSGEFPPMVTQMIRVGEKTGSLEKMLSQVSDNYDNQVQADIDAMTSMLEPVMLIVMGGIIAFIVFSTLIPLLQMYNISGVGA